VVGHFIANNPRYYRRFFTVQRRSRGAWAVVPSLAGRPCLNEKTHLRTDSRQIAFKVGFSELRATLFARKVSVEVLCHWPFVANKVAFLIQSIFLPNLKSAARRDQGAGQTMDAAERGGRSSWREFDCLLPSANIFVARSATSIYGTRSVIYPSIRCLTVRPILPTWLLPLSRFDANSDVSLRYENWSKVDSRSCRTVADGPIRCHLIDVFWLIDSFDTL